jgi:CBS domain-containing protein
VSSHDLLWLEGGHPVALARHIEGQTSIAGLEDTARRLAAVARWLVAGGAGALATGRVVAELHDGLVRRVVEIARASLAAEGHHAPPIAISWIAAGSEGRREQALATDQDNGIVYADPPGGQEEAAARHVQALAARVAEGLERAGVPRCPGGYMAANPRWCQPLRVWRQYAEHWTDTPTGQSLVEASTYADARPVVGDPGPGEAFARHLVDVAAARPLFLRHMARDALQRSPGLGLFGRFALERDGPHRGRVDLKGHGIFPVAQVIRVLALAAGVAETNTMDRLRALAARAQFSAEEARDLAEAYEVLGRLRLRHQLARLDAGEAPDNHVDPRALSRADRLLLRDAFRVVAWLQRVAEDRFQTASVT